jgi:serine/threonine protein kinase
MSSRRVDERPVFPEGKEILQYTLVRLIGRGGYADVYEAIDTSSGQHHALKVEHISEGRNALEREYAIIQNLESPSFVVFFSYIATAEFRCLGLELCGQSLTAVRRALPDHKFSASSVLRSSTHMLRAIRDLHRRGVLHRDIKPSNFLIRADLKYPLALIDYGLSRIFMDVATGRLIQARRRPGFVGTGKYASLWAHEGLELGRRDDLISWYYSMIEMWLGGLPWPSSRDKEEIFVAKSSVDIYKVVRELPTAISAIWRAIRKLGRADEPNYGQITALLDDAMVEVGANWGDLYDWEEPSIDD